MLRRPINKIYDDRHLLLAAITTNNDMPDTEADRESILLETSTVPCHELQRLFASGVVISIANDLDLVATAHLMAQDNKEAIEALISENKMQHVSDDQAKQWYADNTLLWSVVVKPWVLVQDK